MSSARATLKWRIIPGLDPNDATKPDQYGTKWLAAVCNGGCCVGRRNCACSSVSEKREGKDFSLTSAQLINHPLTMLAMVPKDAALFAAGAIAGAAAKAVTAPLDRIKLLMQVFFLSKYCDLLILPGFHMYFRYRFCYCNSVWYLIFSVVYVPECCFLSACFVVR